MPSTDNNNLLRLINQNDQYEGGGIPPRPQGGTRIQTVSGLTVVRNTSVVGGARLTLAWNDENVGGNDYFTIFIYAGFDWDSISTRQNPRDNPANQLNIYQAPLIAYTSPAQIFIPAIQTMQCVITVATRNSGGILSNPDFQASVTATITPLARNVVSYNNSASASGSDVYETTYILKTDTVSTFFVLPPIAGGLPDGFTHTIMKNDASVNRVVVIPAISTETINGSSGDAISGTGTSVKYMAHKLSAIWLKT